MKKKTDGVVKDDFYISGCSVYPIELLDGTTPVLFDAGVTCAGRLYADAIREVLGNREPEMIFITHVHWDHCGATQYLKNVFPSVKIGMSPQAGAILKRRNAISQIKKLNAAAGFVLASLPEIDPSRLIDDPFKAFKADVWLEDGQFIELDGGLTVETLSTPGHTRDHMSYYVPEKKILIASEACGCLDATGRVIVEFLTDYDLYLSSLRRLAELPVEILCQGHRVVYVGRGAVQAFFEQSIRATIRFRDRVLNLLEKESVSLENVVAQIKAEQYDTNPGIKQPEIPYLINLRAQVKHLAEKAGWLRDE
jgi:glyoxylase-like metal-dependent hydrolase (beta-lactamase superfamily II)